VRSESVARRVAAHLGAEWCGSHRARSSHRADLGIAAKRLADAAGAADIEALGREIRGRPERSGGRPSMLQDVMKGRRTEIDYLTASSPPRPRRRRPHAFNDAVVAAFHAHGVGGSRRSTQPRAARPPARVAGTTWSCCSSWGRSGRRHHQRIVGFGSSIMLMPVLVIVFGPLHAVPIMAIAAILANLSRVLICGAR